MVRVPNELEGKCDKVIIIEEINSKNCPAFGIIGIKRPEGAPMNKDSNRKTSRHTVLGMTKIQRILKAYKRNLHTKGSPSY